MSGRIDALTQHGTTKAPSTGPWVMIVDGPPDFPTITHGERDALERTADYMITLDDVREIAIVRREDYEGGTR